MKRFVVLVTFLVCSTLLAGAQQRKSNIELFPVPLKADQLKVRMKPATAGKAASIELRNFIGKKLQSIQCDGNKNLIFTEMRQYPEGVYVVLVKGKNGKIVESAKFTIAK